MILEQIGCCGAYYGTCKVFKDCLCCGCKIGYSNGERDISKAKCKIKKCCMSNNFISCADCDKYNTCETIQTFHNKSGYKYKKYKEAIIFIKDNDYKRFLEIAGNWNMQYGKYK